MLLGEIFEGRRGGGDLYRGHQSGCEFSAHLPLLRHSESNRQKNENNPATGVDRPHVTQHNLNYGPLLFLSLFVLTPMFSSPAAKSQ